MNLKINCTPDEVVQYPMHAHRNYEIMLYLEGEGHMRTELGNVRFEVGTIVIVPPNIMHGSTSKNGFKNISIEGHFDRYFDFDTVKTVASNETQEGLTLAKMIYENRYGNDTYLKSLCTAYLCFITQRIEVDCLLQKVVQKIVFEISQQAFDSQINLALILSKSGYSEDYIRSKRLHISFNQRSQKVSGDWHNSLEYSGKGSNLQSICKAFFFNYQAISKGNGARINRKS